MKTGASEGIPPLANLICSRLNFCALQGRQAKKYSPPGLVHLLLPAICQLIGNLPKFWWYTFSIYRYLGEERHCDSHVFVSSVSCPITHHSDPSLSPALNKKFNELPIRPRAMSAGCNLAKNLKDKLLLEKKIY